ncbi:MAG TPA: zinc-ribbon domain-containing protein, partial [Pyrinomonadaceae bacterium]
MTTCERCNTENLDGSQYCDECGAPLRAATRQVTRVGQDGGDGPPQVAAEAPSPVVAAEAAGPNGGQAAAVSAPSSSAGSAARCAHANLVIERGRSAGKQFQICEDEAQIGRWDADGGIFPDVDLDSDDPEAKVSRRHARITRRSGQYYIE